MVLHLLTQVRVASWRKIQDLAIAFFAILAVALVVGRGGFLPKAASIPGEGAEDQRKLQPFGAMHGEHLHQALVALQAQLSTVAATAATLCGQPIHQTDGR